jgi:hypothetical protein
MPLVNSVYWGLPPARSASVFVQKVVVNGTPVPAEPMFETGAASVSGVPTVAVRFGTVPAVKSGALHVKLPFPVV